MRAENPAALRYILQDDIYLLQSDKPSFTAEIMPTEIMPDKPVTAVSVATNQPEPVTQTPVSTAPVDTKQHPPVAQTALVTAPTTTSAPVYNYLGDNKKHFLILTHYLAEDFIAADHLAALQNILGRKGYELADIAIFNVAKASYTIIDVVNYFKPEKLLILGETAVPAGMGVPPLNQPKKMKNGVLLLSFSFDEMMRNTDNKKAFWDQMKSL